MDIVPWVKASMRRQQVKMTDLSRRSGVPYRTLSDFLRGRSPINSSHLGRLLDALGMQIIAEFQIGIGSPRLSHIKADEDFEEARRRIQQEEHHRLISKQKMLDSALVRQRLRWQAKDRKHSDNALAEYYRLRVIESLLAEVGDQTCRKLYMDRSEVDGYQVHEAERLKAELRPEFDSRPEK